MPTSCDITSLFGGSASSTADGASSGGLGGMLPLLLMLAVFFVLMIVPQRRRQKKVKEMLDAVKAGDKIKTIGGFYGKVEMVKDDLVVITCDPDGNRMTISKSAIATVQNADVENDAEPSS